MCRTVSGLIFRLIISRYEYIILLGIGEMSGLIWWAQKIIGIWNNKRRTGDKFWVTIKELNPLLKICTAKRHILPV
jgi:hypothetical protein